MFLEQQLLHTTDSSMSESVYVYACINLVTKKPVFTNLLTCEIKCKVAVRDHGSLLSYVAHNISKSKI